ncbi:LLM class flavin-dependent oxidoreductase [Bacillus benzoevorans]|uniref:Alkanesulfonate monooxygenase SsuD/methylene tetrahydromethanopterin reductase-like flavin-dependent oxidoreductase (Luciferase family) n=1 Tax=Bacillus benzoevorans TaxID=1456 RepID=A0A7X0HP06_9BACI|nr:LLM class flavin-dependent oxidoreductase [Bacillus benzoevorans]MBB6444322.1 alkanesulfonate monooxygenase SsuD/methylene tetrahydromethanopterin reductase-like flavin-dependent oxidoreductase (luciferase family) [Bacillus benzoevorans]
MKIGYFTLTDNPVEYGDTRKNPNQMVVDLAEQCIYAEDLGFNSVWVPEHHFSALGILPHPASLLTYVAAKTTRIKLAPATVLLPASHPIRVAEEYALLDVLSNGRAIFSAGRGYDQREYEIFDIDYNKSREIFFEGLDIVQKAWKYGKLSYEGEFYSFPEVELTPKPVQENLPIYVAAFSRPTIEKAAEMGEHVIFAPFAANMVFGTMENAIRTFNDISKQHGFTGKKASCSYFVSVVDTEDEAEKAKQRMLKYFTGLVPAFPGDPSKAPKNIQYFVQIIEQLKSITTADLGEKSIIVGNAEYVTQKLKEVEASGVDECILYLDFGGLSHAETMKQMERLAKDVIPHFNQEEAVIG